MSFIQDDFLLSNETAKQLYHEHAAGQPIYDYHCHLPPEDLANNRTFNHLTEIWLDGDHYKWRAMRANGVDEALITGDADPYEQFAAWAKTVPHTIRNPLYHWTHLELKRYFDIDVLLNADTAKEIWEESSQQLKQMPVSTVLDKFNVALIGTTDDPTDNLAHHTRVSSGDMFPSTVVYPAFRPDKSCMIGDKQGFTDYVAKLETASGISCDTFDGFLEAMKARHTFFHKQGCRLSDHGLTHIPADYLPDDDSLRGWASAIYRKRVDARPVTHNDTDHFLRYMLIFLGELDAQAGWVQQLHLGAIRNNNPDAMRELGPDTGFDSIGDYPQGKGLSWYLGSLTGRGHLPKTILYNLNPADNYLFATMAGNFQGGTPGKVQFGSGWWFLDQEEAIRWQINAISNIGLLSRFVGMLTDSRSFMSYPRHEYFRRILCDMLGSDIESGRLPKDVNMIGRVVEDICFNNARAYFGMTLKGRHANP